MSMHTSAMLTSRTVPMGQGLVMQQPPTTAIQQPGSTPQLAMQQLPTIAQQPITLQL
jgi:hypothetical protein